MPHKQSAVLALPVDPYGFTVLVRDYKFSDPLLKIPGGSGETGESPFVTALRELREETGLIAATSRLEYLWQLDKESHIQYVVGVEVPVISQDEWWYEGFQMLVERIHLSDAATQHDLLAVHREVLQTLTVQQWIQRYTQNPGA